MAKLTKQEKLAKSVKDNRKQRQKELAAQRHLASLYRTRKPIKKLKDFTEEQQQRRIDSKMKRLAWLRKHTNGKFGEHQICRHPDHVGLDRRAKANQWRSQRGMCNACAARDVQQGPTVKYLTRVGMARDKLLDAIVDGKLGSGTLKDFYTAGLKAFGGVSGLVTCIKSEYDAADPGSELRRRYLELFVKVMISLSTLGQEEDIEGLSDAEVARRTLELSQAAIKQHA